MYDKSNSRAKHVALRISRVQVRQSTAARLAQLSSGPAVSAQAEPVAVQPCFCLLACKCEKCFSVRFRASSTDTCAAAERGAWAAGRQLFGLQVSAGPHGFSAGTRTHGQRSTLPTYLTLSHDNHPPSGRPAHPPTHPPGARIRSHAWQPRRRRCGWRLTG